MVLVVLVVGMSLVLALTFLSTSGATTSVTQTMSDHAQARQIAESGVAIAVRYIEQTPGWRSDRVSGAWMTDYALLGGTVSVSAEFDPAPVVTPITLDAPSFEDEINELPNPLLSPPMSGTIGGWDVGRAVGVVPTGANVPRIGVIADPTATDGAQIAFVTFPATVIGDAWFTQTLAQTLAPDTDYALTVDVDRVGGFALTEDLQLQVHAGPTLVASSSDPAMLVTQVGVAGDYEEYTLRFTTDDAPPAGAIRVTLFAQSTVVAASNLMIDNVRLVIEDHEPATLTGVARYQQASHRVTATVDPGSTPGPAPIVTWSE